MANNTKQLDYINLLKESEFLWIIDKNFENPNNNHDDMYIISTEIKNHSLGSYQGIENIMKKIIEEFYEEFPIETKQVENSYKELEENWKNTDISADSVLYSIIRRISRESKAAMRLIDNLCVEISNLFESVYHKKNKKVAIIVNEAEWLDRASIRILYRLCKISNRNSLSILWAFAEFVNNVEEDKVEYDDIRACISLARYKIFSKVLLDLNPKVIRITHDVTSYQNVDYTLFEDNLLGNAALALVTQNYESAYVACYAQLLSGKEEEVFRILGLVHANLGMIEKSYKALQKAIVATHDKETKAHLEYLSALLATKRLYKFDLAHSHYNKGMKYVENEENSQSKLEKSWIYNGLSFLNVVENRNNTEEEKNTIFVQVLERELKALEIIKNEKGIGPAYLRFNLISNITFLLEIKKDYKLAMNLWHKEFGKFFEKYNNKATLSAAYYYRLGMLAWKARNISFALENLNVAVEIAKGNKDRFNLERIYYGLGCVLLEERMYKESAEVFSKALFLAIEMCEWQNLKDHMVGYVLAYDGIEKSGKSLEHILFEIKNCCSMEEIFKQLNVENISSLIYNINNSTLTKPKTKLSSYHPSIDLEDTPNIDMNEYLIS
ncbi:hypothetical protein [Bacillus cereus group sp. BfR-BA-01380]|uniref:hypothetical protein n=1 Tax=Bacillus cereus group sp. BfR-BA-01380 TaxID=2920324 RepID=UPI001F589613|nr:hypothetical protein [Bacillus cereus group sp. BfR-BA-01380]